jgi:hypothetical protein
MNPPASFSLTNKSQGVYRFASEEFAKRYFTDISLIYTRYSLQTFVEICKHPILGCAVRKVRLSYVRFIPECFEAESRRLLDDFYYGTLSEQRHEALEDMRRLVNRCDEEEFLKGSGDAKDLLAAAFTTLSQWDHPLELSVSDSESSAIGTHHIHGRALLGQHSRWECDILGTVALLYRVAILSECIVQRLQITGSVWDNLVDSSPSLSGVLARLPELELDIWPASNQEMEDIAGLEYTVTKLLSITVSLKSLHLDAFDAINYLECLDKCFSTMSVTRLEKLTLGNVDFDVFNPFERQIESLRHLEITYCRTGEGWHNIWLSIQKNFPRLEYFEFSGIELQGVQGVKGGINKLIQAHR